MKLTQEEIDLIDGRMAESRQPLTLTEEELSQFDPVREAETQQSQRDVKGFGRQLLKGGTFAFGDEIEAYLSDGNYGENLGRIRAEMEQYSLMNPGLAFTTELAPAMLTGGLLMKGATKLGGAMGAGTRAATLEGGLYGAGEGTDAASRVTGAAIGAPIGWAAGRILGGGRLFGEAPTEQRTVEVAPEPAERVIDQFDGDVESAVNIFLDDIGHPNDVRVVNASSTRVNNETEKELVNRVNTPLNQEIILRGLYGPENTRNTTLKVNKREPAPEYDDYPEASGQSNAADYDDLEAQERIDALWDSFEDKSLPSYAKEVDEIEAPVSPVIDEGMPTGYSDALDDADYQRYLEINNNEINEVNQARGRPSRIPIEEPVYRGGARRGDTVVVRETGNDILDQATAVHEVAHTQFERTVATLDDPTRVMLEEAFSYHHSYDNYVKHYGKKAFEEWYVDRMANVATARTMARLTKNKKAQKELAEMYDRYPRRRIDDQDLEIFQKHYDDLTVANQPQWGSREVRQPATTILGKLGQNIEDWYEKIVPMTDLLMSKVSPRVGGGAQRADETATRMADKDFNTYVLPIQKVAAAFDTNRDLRQALLEYSEGNLSRGRLLAFVKKSFSEEDALALGRYLQWSTRINKEQSQNLAGLTNQGDNYLHRQRIYEKDEMDKAMEAEFNDTNIEDELPYDVGRLKRKISVAADPSQANQYQNPLLTNTKRIFNNERLRQYAIQFGVKNVPRGTTSMELMGMIEKRMVQRGVEPSLAEFAKDQIVTNMKGQNRSMNEILQMAQSIGYVGTLAGPKSAILNLHDIPASAVMYGPKSLRNWSINNGVTAKSMGFSTQKFGEFANQMMDTFRGGKPAIKASLERTSKVADKAMKASGFEFFDQVGKGGVMRTVQQSVVDTVGEEGWEGLRKNWSMFFDDDELKRVANLVSEHGMDYRAYPDGRSKELFEEMISAGLGQQQLISGGGRPSSWANNPNARVLFALRGFAMKQQAFAMRNIVGNIKDGNTKDAADWAVRYAIFAMGGFAAINEGRQIIFGDGEARPERFLRSFFDQAVGVATLNSIGVNDYAWGQIQQEGLMSTILKGNIPIAADIPLDVIMNVFNGLTDPDTSATKAIESMPLIKQWSNVGTNTKEGAIVDAMKAYGDRTNSNSQ